MSSTEKVVYEVMAKTDGAVESLKTMQKAMSSLQDGMQALGSMVAFDKLAGAMTKMLTASHEAEVSQRRFYNTMVATGQAVNPDRFYELADALEKVSTYQDDETIAAGAMLARFRMTQTQIEGMLPGIQDLAAFMGTDLASAADGVGRAMSVGAAGLRALNLGFSASEKAAFDMATQSQRADIIMRRIQGTIGGTAAIMANTAVGATKQFHNALDGLLAAFGKVLDKPIANALHHITDAVRSTREEFDRLHPSAKTTLGAITLGAVGVGSVALAISGLAGAVGALAKLWPTFVAGWGVLGGAMKAVLSPLLVIALGIGSLILLVGAFKTAWDGDLGGMKTTALEWISTIQTKFTAFIDGLQTKWRNFAQTFTDLWIVAKGSFNNLSPDEIDAQIAKSHGSADSGTLSQKIKEGAGILSTQIQVAFEAAKMGLNDSWEGLKQTWGVGTDTLKAIFKSFGMDVDRLFSDQNKQGSGQPPRGGAGGSDGIDSRYSLGDLQSRKPFEVSDAAASKHAASSLAGDFGGGDAGSKAASDFMAKMARVYHLSEKVVEGIAQAADGSRAVIDEIASSMDGMGDGVAQRLIRLSNGNEGDLQRAANAFRGFSDEAVGTYEKLAGGNLDEMVRMGNEASAAWKASLDSIRDAGANAKRAIDSGQGVPSGGGEPPKGKDGATAGDLALNSIGNMLQGATVTGEYQEKMADPGGIAGSAIQGGMMGGPVGAIAGAVAGILQQTEGFQEIVAKLGAILHPMVDALEPLLDAIEPFLSLVQLGVNIFVSLMKVLSPLVDLVRLIGEVMEHVATAIAVVYNGLLETIASVLDFIAWVLPDWAGGDTFEDAANGVRNAKISLEYGEETRKINKVTEDNTDATKDLTKAIEQSTQNVPSGWVVSSAQYRSVVPGMGDPMTPQALMRDMVDKVLSAQRTVNVTVYANDANDVYRRVKQAAALDNYRTTGSTVTNGSSPFGVPKSTSGYGR